MGELRFQNEPLTSAMLLGLDEEMELLCNHATGSEESSAVEELMAFVCIGFGAGLRGQEVTLTSLKGMVMGRLFQGRSRRQKRTIPSTPLIQPQESGSEGSQEESSFG